MKLKPRVIGTLLYLALFGVTTTAVLATGIMVCPFISYTFVILVGVGILVGDSFLIKALSKALLIDLTIAALGLLLLLFTLLLVLGETLNFEVVLRCSLTAFIVWTAGATGFALASLCLRKWDSRKARRWMAVLSPLPAILIAAGYFSIRHIAYTRMAATSRLLGEPALVANADELVTTKVAADLGEPLVAGTNMIWCGTFQLAWNAMSDLIGEEIRFAANEPANVGRLNQREVIGEYLDAETFLSLAGPHTRQFMKEANQATAAKFGAGAFAPEALPDANDPRNLAAMAYLVANLPFQHAFERTTHGMVFNKTRVESFTIPFSNELSTQKEKVERQVRIQYPPEEGAFIVELLTRDRDHHLLLAKVTPESTLAATVEKTLAQVDSLPRKALETNQHLEVPLFNFDITKHYSALSGKELAVKNRAFQGGRIARAEQNIRFQLDERGAVMKSSSFLCVFSVSAVPDCVFDEPFLLMLRYRDHPKPYFAMWIDNAEILVEKGL